MFRHLRSPAVPESCGGYFPAALVFFERGLCSALSVLLQRIPGRLQTNKAFLATVDLPYLHDGVTRGSQGRSSVLGNDSNSRRKSPEIIAGQVENARSGMIAG